MGKDTQQKTGRVHVKREFSSGGAVVKNNLWLVTLSAQSILFPKQVWRLPKGWVDVGETLEQAALREVREEAGIEAKIIKKIETIKYFFKHPERGNILKFVTFYLMEWERDLPEGFGEETSEIAWLSFEKTYKKLSFGGEKQILKKANEILTSGLV